MELREIYTLQLAEEFCQLTREAEDGSHLEVKFNSTKGEISLVFDKSDTRESFLRKLDTELDALKIDRSHLQTMWSSAFSDGW